MRVQVSSCQPAGRPAPTAASPVSNATACTVAGLHSARPRARARADERTPRRTDSASQGCGYHSAREQAATHHRSMPDRSRVRRRTDCRRTATPSQGAVLHRRQQGSPRCSRWHPVSHRPEPSPRRPHRGTAECLAAQIVSRVGRVRLPNAAVCCGRKAPVSTSALFGGLHRSSPMRRSTIGMCIRSRSSSKRRHVRMLPTGAVRAAGPHFTAVSKATRVIACFLRPCGTRSVTTAGWVGAALCWSHA